MNILIWHVHGSWMTAFVAGPHHYLIPALLDRSSDGRGRAQTWDWPASAIEVAPDRLRDLPIDVVILQRPQEAQLVRTWTGLRPGIDVPAIHVEHNTPRGDVADWRHPHADGKDVAAIVHVTSFNEAMWDNGRTPTRVIEHGIADPGYRWTGEQASLAVCVNEPVRRWRVAGMDLAARVAAAAPLHVYGMGLQDLHRRFADNGIPADRLAGLHEDLPQQRLHQVLGTHAAYLHPYRWTSLGLALIEAMTLGMPCLVLAATAAPEAVPPDVGVVSADVGHLTRAAAHLLTHRDEARAMGLAAREHALARFGLDRFLADWDALLAEVTA